MNQHKVSSNLRSIKYLIGAAVLIFAVNAVFTGTRAHASDVYFGKVDSFTGEREDESESSEAAEETIIWLTDNGYYDKNQKLYGFTTSEGDVYATVPDGMVTDDNVTVYIPDGMESVIYWDGLSAEFIGGTLSSPGGYTVEVTVEGEQIQLFSFFITGTYTNSVLNYTVPSGFRILSATRDGEVIDFTRYYVDMSLEGKYMISYDCPTADLAYSLNVTVDTTPPTLTLIGVDEDGKARGPVTLTDKGENDTLYITRDGEALSMILTYTFTQSGRYEVTVTDPAGNYTVYPFTIMIYLDRNGWIFGAILVAVIASVVAYIIYSRKHLKVR